MARKVREDQAKPKPRNTHATGLRRIRIEVGRDANGKQIRRDFYGKTLKEARAKAQLFMEEQKQSAALLPESPGLTVKQWADRWLSAYGSGAGYSANRTTEINSRKLVEAIGMMQLADVRNEDIQRFANRCAHYAKSTVLKIKMTTNGIFRRAIENHLIDRSPCSGVQWRYASEGTHRCLEEWEINTICQYWQEHRIGLCVMLMLWAGLRRGEALALRWEDIDMEGEVIHVRQGAHFEANTAVYSRPKTNSSIRSIPIFPPLYAALKRSTTILSGGHVCANADGSPITLSGWREAWTSYLTAMTNCISGEQPIRPGRRSDLLSPRQEFSVRPHDLRHTFASMLYDSGVDPKTTQRLLGHASIETTLKTYVHLQSRRNEVSVNQMADYAAKFTTPATTPILPQHSAEPPVK